MKPVTISPMPSPKPESQQAFEELDETKPKPPTDIAHPILRKITAALSILIASGLTFAWQYKTLPPATCLIVALPAFFATRSACAQAREKTIVTDLAIILITTLLLVFAFVLCK